MYAQSWSTVPRCGTHIPLVPPGSWSRYKEEQHVILWVSIDHILDHTPFRCRESRPYHEQPRLKTSFYPFVPALAALFWHCSPMVTLTSLPALSLQHTEVELYSGRRRRRRRNLQVVLMWVLRDPRLTFKSCASLRNATSVLAAWHLMFALWRSSTAADMSSPQNNQQRINDFKIKLHSRTASNTGIHKEVSYRKQIARHYSCHQKFWSGKGAWSTV